MIQILIQTWNLRLLKKEVSEVFSVIATRKLFFVQLYSTFCCLKYQVTSSRYQRDHPFLNVCSHVFASVVFDI